MTRIAHISVGFLMLLFTGCTTPPANGTTVLTDRTSWVSESPVRGPMEPPKDGKILVFVSGDARSRGPHWIPEGANILQLERVSGAGDAGPVTIEPKFVVIRRAVDGRLLELRYDLKRRTQVQKLDILLQHGDSITFPWTNCW